jgi:gentisate 1,2-dioxygenase
MSKAATEKSRQRLQALNVKMRTHALRGAWQRERGFTKFEEIRPHLWRWSDMLPLLLEAGEIAPLDEVMRMRTLHMTNSPAAFPVGAAQTFAAMLQHVNGGEVTDSHRHTATSIYFMIQGRQVYTTAEGEQQFMEPGDLLTQPSWTWHGTTNTGKEPAIWFTAMDTTLMQFLDNWVNERYPDSFSQPVSKLDGFHMQRLGALRQAGALDGQGPFPLRYRWSETLRSLDELAASSGLDDPCDGVILDYVNPQTGGPTTATLNCRIQLLRPGQRTAAHRHTCSVVYHVVSGAGAIRLGKRDAEQSELLWQERDCFNLPPGYWHRLENRSKEPALLFSVSDRPLYEALGLYREES